MIKLIFGFQYLFSWRNDDIYDVFNDKAYKSDEWMKWLEVIEVCYYSILWILGVE